MRRPRREPWPWILVALLAAMILGSFAFLRLAVVHADPLVVDDAYAAGLAYNDHVRAERHGESLGWKLDLVATPEPGAIALALDVREASGAALRADRVSVRRERPAEGGLDAEFPLAAPVDGERARWTATVPLPRAGRWRLVARVERGDDVVERAFAFEAR